MTLHDIHSETLMLTFSREDNAKTFRTTANRIDITPFAIWDNDRLIARLGQDNMGGPIFRPPDQRSEVWYDTLTIEIAGDDR